MFKIEIKKQNQITNRAMFETESEALAWLAREEANNSFGKLERWVKEGLEDVSNALDSRVTEIMGMEVEEFLLPKEYEVVGPVEFVDQDKINQEAKAYLASTDYLVIRMSETGVAMDEAIMVLRQAARDRIVG